jgi:multimeric flavodoxin WrbA
LTNVIAINGSPKMEKGNTVKILKPFLEGMETAGASFELFYAKRMNVRPCDGELYCWTKKPGQCYIDDSMQSFYPNCATPTSSCWLRLFVFHCLGRCRTYSIDWCL